MTDARLEILWEQAKIRYPIGTQFRVAHSPKSICTIRSHDKYAYTFIRSGGNCHINFQTTEELVGDEESYFNADYTGASVWCTHHGWAEKIETTKKDIDNLISEL